MMILLSIDPSRPACWSACASPRSPTTVLQSFSLRSLPGLNVELVDKKLPAFLAAAHLTDQIGLADKALKYVRSLLTLTHRLYPVGSIISDVLVVACEGTKNPTLVLSLKPALKSAVAQGKVPTAIDQLADSQAYPAYVRGVSEHGVFIGLVHGLSGLVRRQSIGVHFVRDPSRMFTKGQTVFVELDKVATFPNGS